MVMRTPTRVSNSKHVEHDSRDDVSWYPFFQLSGTHGIVRLLHVAGKLDSRRKSLKSYVEERIYDSMAGRDGAGNLTAVSSKQIL